MHSFPHVYRVASSSAPEGEVVLTSGDLPPLPTTSPPEFDGPSGYWSPETLLVASVVNCFILTFRAIAKASRMPWTDLAVDCVGTLERPERVTQFTRFDLRARLRLPAGANDDQARRLLTRAEETCLITRSLKAAVHLEIDIVRAQESTDVHATQQA